MADNDGAEGDCLLTAVGAAIPARSIVSISAFEIGSSVYCRMLVRVMMFLIASFEHFSHCADTLNTDIANNRLMVIIFFIYLLLKIISLCINALTCTVSSFNLIRFCV